MEVYYKDLISEDASLEKLIDDLSRVVQGAEAFAQEVVGAKPQQEMEISSRVQRMKDSCRKVREQAVSGAQATDRVLRRNPYYFAGVAFAAGLLAGLAVCTLRNRR